MKTIQNILQVILLIGLFAVVQSCGEQDTTKEETKLSIDFEKYTLENGLQVILHKDDSDPIVSAAIMYHVGSNREVEGRTGFAHLFEHMLFQESENVPQDQFFKKIQDAGGTLNGGTWQDGTVYYEVVPKNALEMVLWLESDRMGFLINTVTETAFANQQEVVQNEKRQRVDNNPYGHTSYVIDKNIFPKGHPYNWQVIGELVDLQNATVEDVKEFYRKFYGPNNATLVLAGDFDTKEAKALIEKYFGEIKKGPEVPPLEIRNVTLDKTVRLYHEDNFARAAQLNMVWPTIHEAHKDQYALQFLGQLLSEGKKAPLYKVLVKEKELTSNTVAYSRVMEVAGKFRVSITANEGKNLTDIESAVLEAFKKFEEEGITDKDIERVKASLETDVYNGISSILNKSFQLANYNVFRGDPGFITQDVENILAVSKEDVLNVYNKYIKDKPYVITSFVPKGGLDLVAENSVKAEVVEEEISENTEKKVADATPEEIKKTPSKIDRSTEPIKGADPIVTIPVPWEDKLNNGMVVYGMEQSEVPLVQFNIVLRGGHLLDSFDKNGVSNLMTDIMSEGTKNKTPEELEEEIELLGANISMYTSSESITISANTLARNFEKTLALVEEILLEPRWDLEEFERIKTRTINGIQRSAANPNVVADQVYNKLLYGPDHIMSYPGAGTEESVAALTIDDLKEYYDKYYSPTVARFHVVGAVDKEKVMSSLAGINERWKAKDVTIPEYKIAPQPETASLYFLDIPNSKQSVINIGYLAKQRTDEDYYATTVMNYKLGGSFSGNVNLILREEKGYTYGARTNFDGSTIIGPFTASSSVRTNATFESVQIFKEEMEKYRNGISQEDLDFTKNALIKSNARAFETYGALLGMMRTMSAYNFSSDYIAKQQGVVKTMTLEEHKALAEKYIIPDKMIYLVVGDAATQFDRFKNTGFDQIKLIDKDGKEVEIPIMENMNK